jgi:hypothetical protein
VATRKPQKKGGDILPESNLDKFADIMEIQIVQAYVELRLHRQPWDDKQTYKDPRDDGYLKGAAEKLAVLQVTYRYLLELFPEELKDRNIREKMKRAYKEIFGKEDVSLA